MQVNERNDQTTTRVFIVVRLQGLFFLALRPRPEYPTREFLSLVNKLLSPAEKTLHVAYTFTDTKLDVEFFYKGTTTPNTLCILRTKILTTHFRIYTNKWRVNNTSLHNTKLPSLATLCWKLVTFRRPCELLCYKRKLHIYNVKRLEEKDQCVCKICAQEVSQKSSYGLVFIAQQTVDSADQAEPSFGFRPCTPRVPPGLQ